MIKHQEGLKTCTITGRRRSRAEKCEFECQSMSRQEALSGCSERSRFHYIEKKTSFFMTILQQNQ